MRCIGGLTVVLLLAGCASTGTMDRHGHSRPVDRVVAAYATYLGAFDTVSAAGGEGVGILQPLVTREQFVLERAHADLLRLGGYWTSGSSAFDTVTVLAALSIRVCLDTSRVRTFDASGTDITTGPPRRGYDVTFVTSETPPFALLLEGVEPSEHVTC
jgi:hypothetical protein